MSYWKMQRENALLRQIQRVLGGTSYLDMKKEFRFFPMEKATVFVFTTISFSRQPS